MQHIVDATYALLTLLLIGIAYEAYEKDRKEQDKK